MDVLAQSPFKDEAGIYLWAIEQTTGRYRTCYLGQTITSFQKRNTASVIHTLGGYDDISDPEQMRKGLREPVWAGLWGRTRGQLHEFIQRYAELAPVIRSYLLSQVMFLAPLERDKRLQQRVEGALARHLLADPEKRSFLRSDIRFLPRRLDETPIAVLISAEANIEGLPQRLQA